MTLKKIRYGQYLLRTVENEDTTSIHVIYITTSYVSVLKITHRDVTIVATFEFRSRESFVSHLQQRRHNRAGTPQTSPTLWRSLTRLITLNNYREFDIPFWEWSAIYWNFDFYLNDHTLFTLVVIDVITVRDIVTRDAKFSLILISIQPSHYGTCFELRKEIPKSRLCKNSLSIFFFF
ncbi:hypothetical protein YC2023_065692 [Brassica napus]